MRTSTSVTTFATVAVLIAGLAPGLVLGVGDDQLCYPGPPVVGDCVTEEGDDEFCHLHFLLVSDTECDRSRPVRMCTYKWTCRWDSKRKLWRKTEATLKVYAQCKDPQDVDEPQGCWHCPASLICRVDRFYQDPYCTRQTSLYRWFRMREACY